VQQQGSLAGMLQAVGVPLCHLGYSLSAPAEGMDLQYMQLTAAKAVQVMQQHVQQVHDGCVALGWQLPAKPARPVLLQCTPDLLCADREALQQLLEAPAVAPQAALGAAAGSVAAALTAAVGVVQAVARGDASGAQQLPSRLPMQQQQPLQQLMAYSSSFFWLASSSQSKSSRRNRCSRTCRSSQRCSGSHHLAQQSCLMSIKRRQSQVLAVTDPGQRSMCIHCTGSPQSSNRSGWARNRLPCAAGLAATC
jgi:hypothetical protein